MAGKRVLSKSSKSCRRSAAGIWIRVLTLALLAAVLLVPRPAQARKWSFLNPRGQWRVIDDAKPRTKPAFTTTATFNMGDIIWNVTYLDPDGVGFNDPDLGGARRGCVTRALNAISSWLNRGQAGTVDVVFTESVLDGSSFLALGGTYFPDPSSEPCFYSGFAYEHLRKGVDPSPELEDIYCTVDFGYDWYTGTGFPASDEYDLTSVILHELTHGLGFISLLGADGTSVIDRPQGEGGAHAVRHRAVHLQLGADGGRAAPALRRGVAPRLRADRGPGFAQARAAPDAGRAGHAGAGCRLRAPAWLSPDRSPSAAPRPSA